MKLEFRGHDDRYAIEQSLLAFFPEERPVYESITPEDDDCALVSLTEGKRYATGVTTLHYHGKTARGVSRAVLTDAPDEYERERLRQRALKLSFFKAARNITGITPSWGALTGIRPGKLARAMLEQGKIDQAAYDAAKEENVVFSNGYTILGGRVDVDTDKKDDTDTDGGDEQPEEETKTATSSQSYFTDAVIEDVAAALVEKYGLTDSTNPVTGKVTTAFDQGVNMVYGKGYKIYTTQHPDYQKIAEEVCSDTSNLPYTSTYTNSYGEKETEQLQVGMTIVDPYTGYVVAMVGGAGVKQYDRGWNWATSARQCGSAIKPISVYAPALDDGTINGASSIDDYPVMVLNGSAYPKNANGRYMGLTPLHTAIARSTNTCAVRVVQEYGTSRSYDFMTNKLGFTTLTSQDAQQVGNMGLGGLDRGVTTEEMAAAFAAFANEGIYTAPRTFVRVEDADGNVILENEAKSSGAMKDTTAALMNSLLQEVVTAGTGGEGRISGMHVAGKTGTTNNDQDRYFVGYTPYYSCAVWVGYVHNQRIVASGNPAASMWQKVMSRIHADLPDKDFFSCSGLTYVKVCADSGLLATDSCAEDCRGSRVYSALVAADNAPSAYCNMHTSPIYTVNFVEEDGTITTASGSMLDYTRPRLEGFEDIEAEDDFMLTGTSWGGFFGDDDDDADEPDDTGGTGGEDGDIHTSWWGCPASAPSDKALKQQESAPTLRPGRSLYACGMYTGYSADFRAASRPMRNACRFSSLTLAGTVSATICSQSISGQPSASHMAPNSTTFMHLGLPSASAMSLAGTAMVLKLRAMAAIQPAG